MVLAAYDEWFDRHKPSWGTQRRCSCTRCSEEWRRLQSRQAVSPVSAKNISVFQKECQEMRMMMTRWSWWGTTTTTTMMMVMNNLPNILNNSILNLRLQEAWEEHVCKAEWQRETHLSDQILRLTHSRWINAKVQRPQEPLWSQGEIRLRKLHAEDIHVSHS